MSNSATPANLTQQKISPSGHSHSFDTGIAESLGVNCAIIFNHITYWLRKNYVDGINQIENRTWMYESISKMARYLPYFTERQVRHAIAELVKNGILIEGYFSKNVWDRTTWYALGDESILSGSKKLYEQTSVSHEHQTNLSHVVIVEKKVEKEQQQGKESAAAAIYPSLEKIPDSEVSQAEKKRISSKYDEVTVNDAVARVLQSDFVIEVSLLKSLNAACKGKWKPEKSKASEKEAQAEKSKMKQYLQEMPIYEKNGTIITFPQGETANIKEDDPKEINKIFKKYEMEISILNNTPKKKKSDP